MSLENLKITDEQISEKGVVQAPDKLTGSASENKKLFDRLIREVVKESFNTLITTLVSTGGATSIGATNESGEESTVQALISLSLETSSEAKKLAEEAKETASDAAGGDLSNYVKKTDFATTDTAGVVVGATARGTNVVDSGIVSTYPASAAKDIPSRHAYRPIVPANFMSALKYFMSSPTEDEKMTDEEKTAAADWLGIRIAIVEYTGTGVSGADNPCSVALPFAPSVMRILACNGKSVIGSNEYVRDVIVCGHLTTEYEEGKGFHVASSSSALNKSYAKKSEDGKTVFWYVADNTDSGPSKQLNSSTAVYTVIAM